MLLILRKRLSIKQTIYIVGKDNIGGAGWKRYVHTIVYVPEGNSKVDENDVKIINEYTKVISECGLTTHQITSQTKRRVSSEEF